MNPVCLISPPTALHLSRSAAVMFVFPSEVDTQGPGTLATLSALAPMVVHPQRVIAIRSTGTMLRFMMA
jgi:hypothetical protein